MGFGNDHGEQEVLAEVSTIEDFEKEDYSKLHHVTAPGKPGSNVRERSCEERHQDLYTVLVTEASYTPVDDSPLVALCHIPWVDKSLIEHSINFHKQHLTQLILANILGLLIGFALKPNSTVVLRTGKLTNPEFSFRRLLSTIQRISDFFLVTIDEEKAFKTVDTVRKMHAIAGKMYRRSPPPPRPLTQTLNSSEGCWKKKLTEAMQADLKHIDTSSAPKHLLTWNPPLPIRQLDMATTQFGFVGIMWMFPRLFGIKDRCEEMKGIMHTWAIYGRLLGMKDEFNICIKPDAEVFDKLFQNIFVGSLKTMDETVVTIQSSFMEGLTKRLPFLTYKALLFTGLQDVEGYNGENLWNLMSFWDKVSVKLIEIWMLFMRTSTIYRFFINIGTGIWIQFQFWIHLPANQLDIKALIKILS